MDSVFHFRDSVSISGLRILCFSAVHLEIAHEQLSPQLTLLWTLKAVKGLLYPGEGEGPVYNY